MKILTFDGGGLRSIFSARIVQRIIKNSSDFLTKADLIAGTSGGSIVGCALASGIAPGDVVSLFAERGDEIFTPSSLADDIEDLWDLTGAKYTNKGLKRVLSDVFKQQTLGSLEKKILVTAFDLRHPTGRWQPAVFQNIGGPTATPELSVLDAIMRSTAAPTYFPVYQKFADGGVWGNHPGMAALAAALNPYVGNARFDKVSVLSIGTGRNPMQLRTAKNDLGSVDWLKNGIVDLLLDGSMEAIDYYLKSILGPRYFRVQFDIPLVEVKLDDLDQVQTMIGFADGYDGRDLRAWMEGFWV